jgi:hypothetical protein
MPPLRGPFPTTWEKNTFYDTEIEQISAGGPPACLKAVAEWVGFLAIRLFNRQHGADEPSALRHPLFSQASMRTSPRTLWALDKK